MDNIFQEYKRMEITCPGAEALLTMSDAGTTASPNTAVSDESEAAMIITSFRAPYESNVMPQMPFKGDPVLAVFALPLVTAEIGGMIFEPSTSCDASASKTGGAFTKFLAFYKKHSVDNPSATMVSMAFSGAVAKGYFVGFLPDMSTIMDDGNTRRMSVMLRVVSRWNDL